MSFVGRQVECHIRITRPRKYVSIGRTMMPYSALPGHGIRLPSPKSNVIFALPGHGRNDIRQTVSRMPYSHYPATSRRDIQYNLKQKGSKVEERLAHLRMEVKFEVLIEKKKIFGELEMKKVVVGEGVVVISSTLETLTNSCLRGIMVSLIFLEGFEEEAFVEFMVDFG
ncbi:hypothetical protein Tco_0742858 [Tanacetum coccineum]